MSNYIRYVLWFQDRCPNVYSCLNILNTILLHFIIVGCFSQFFWALLFLMLSSLLYLDAFVLSKVFIRGFFFAILEFISCYSYFPLEYTKIPFKVLCLNMDTTWYKEYNKNLLYILAFDLLLWKSYIIIELYRSSSNLKGS